MNSPSIIPSKSKKNTKKQDDDDKPEMTGRYWAGEHWDLEEADWSLPEGKWWDPEIINEDASFGAWVDGEPNLDYFYWYYEFIYDPTKFVYPNRLGQCHKDWAKKAAFGKRKLFLCPRDHFKTSFLNVGRGCYLACEEQKKAAMGMLFIAWDPGLSGSTYMDIKENLEENEKILSFYGYLIDDERRNNAGFLFFKFSPTGSKFGIKCTSFKSGGITGSHPYYVFLDDIEDEELSENLMRKFHRVILNKLIPAMGNDGEMQVTGTIKGLTKKTDAYLLLKENPLWFCYTFPAANQMPPWADCKYEQRWRDVIDPTSGLHVIDPDTHLPRQEPYFYVEVEHREEYILLYPERYTIEDLVAKRLEIVKIKEKTDDVFWSEYFLRAVNPEGKFFNTNRLGMLPPPGYGSFKNFITWLNENHIKPSIWIDPGGKGKKSHGIAMAIVAIYNQFTYILDLKVIHAGLPTVARELYTWIMDYGVEEWGVEGNYNQAMTFGETLDVYLKTLMKEHNMLDYYTMNKGANNTGDKILRI